MIRWRLVLFYCAQVAFACKLVVPKAVFDRGSLVRAEGCTVDPAAKYELLVNGVTGVANRLGPGGLDFEFLPEDKAPAGFWKLQDALPQPVATIVSLQKNGKPEGESLTAKLYSRPYIVNDRSAHTVSKGETLTLAIANLSKLPENEQLYLYFDGKPLGIPSGNVTAPDSGTMQFRLTADGTPDQAARLLPAWRAVMAAKGYDKVAMSVAVGTAAKILAESGVKIHIERVQSWKLAFWGVFALGVIVGLFVLGAESELLREKCDPPPDGRRRAFSLARVQMAFWFAILLCAVCLFWAVLGEELSIPTNLLALMGVSGGTYVLAQMVDSANPSGTKTPIPTEGFIKDLLTSVNGVELHRFQMVVWTLVFGIMVITEFAQTLVLPDPTAASLTLMGMSSGLYVALKVPEKKT